MSRGGAGGVGKFDEDFCLPLTLQRVFSFIRSAGIEEKGGRIAVEGISAVLEEYQVNQGETQEESPG